MARNFGVDGTVGLSGVLSGQVPAASALQATDDPNLFVMPAGAIPPNPSEMLGSVALDSLLKEFRRDYFIILDAPPVLPVADATIVSTMVDGVVFVVAVGQTRKTEASAARKQLDQVKARTLGVVMNMVSLKDDGGYGYGYYRQNRSYYVTPKKQKGEVPTGAPKPVAARPENSVTSEPQATDTTSDVRSLPQADPLPMRRRTRS